MHRYPYTAVPKVTASLWFQKNWWSGDSLESLGFLTKGWSRGSEESFGIFSKGCLWVPGNLLAPFRKGRQKLPSKYWKKESEWWHTEKRNQNDSAKVMVVFQPEAKGSKGICWLPKIIYREHVISTPRKFDFSVRLQASEVAKKNINLANNEVRARHCYLPQPNSTYEKRGNTFLWLGNTVQTRNYVTFLKTES